MPTLKVLTRLIKFLAVGAFLIVLFAFTVSTVFFSDCGYEQQLENYKNLPEARLNKLFSQMEKIFNEITGYYLDKEKADILYPEIADLEFKHIDIAHQLVVIGGCFDNKLMMRFGGLSGSIDKNPSISIWWGEHPVKSKILWRK